MLSQNSPHSNDETHHSDVVTLPIRVKSEKMGEIKAAAKASGLSAAAFGRQAIFKALADFQQKSETAAT